MGDYPKQSGDSDYGDSEYAPSLVNFLLPDDDAEDQEEQLSPASSIASFYEQHDAIRSAAAAEWESGRAESALRESIALGETPDTPGTSSSYTKAAAKTHPKWGPRPPYRVPAARVRPVSRRGQVLPPVPPFDTAGKLTKTSRKTCHPSQNFKRGFEQAGK